MADEKKTTAATDTEEPSVFIRTYFVRGRNALVARAEFSDLYRDYYLHLMQHEVRYEGEHDTILKETMAGLCLHLASRPRTEAAAWTLNFQDPLINVFVTGDNRYGNVVGRVFTEDVRKADENLMHAQGTENGEPTRKSAVTFTGSEPFSVIEHYYAQSEQRPARLFRHAEEDFVMVSAQPDCDLTWFAMLNDEAIRELDKTETLSLLETRQFTFQCGCTMERMLPVLAPLPPEDLDEVFGGDPHVYLDCPRCSARFKVTRKLIDEIREK